MEVLLKNDSLIIFFGVMISDLSKYLQRLQLFVDAAAHTFNP